MDQAQFLADLLRQAVTEELRRYFLKLAQPQGDSDGTPLCCAFHIAEQGVQ